MKAVNLSSLNLNKTAGIVAISAVSGALAGFAGLAAYGLLAGKGSAAAWAARTAVGGAGGSGLGWLNLLIPASAGTVGGGVSGLGVARKTLNQQAQTAVEQFEAEVDGLRQEVAALQARLEVKQAPVANAGNLALERIRGIGPIRANLTA